MMLKSKSSQSKRSAWTLLRAGLAGLAVAVGGAALTAGCLDRPVAPAVPKTSNIYVDEIRQTAVDKIDLLFMIDNSISMADKQAILADAVPLLVQRLVTPICVRACTKADNCSAAQEKDGIPSGGNADANGKCAQGSPEFNPIKDIHVGVITSSLGSHGAAGAKDVCVSAEDNDHAHLLGALRTGLTPYDGNGFLKWDTTKPPKYTPAGDSDANAFGDKFTAMVKSAGEHGCGYEASLEAWYRFLIDPEPAGTVAVPMGSSTAVVQDTDGTVLEQRRNFLRPDSLVAIVMLSDENDCSIQDEGYGWLIARAAPMYRSTSQCANNPNDKCCQSCAETKPNAGCPDIKADAECVKGQTLAAGDDDLNLRCWQQKRRFGFELLYPTARYSEGLRSRVILNRANQPVGNPLFAAADGKTPRDQGLVFLAGIIGVPWQDIADADSLTGAGLRYLTEAELEAQGRWATILGTTNVGTYDAPIPPTDPLMIEQPGERSGANPITGDAIAPSTSTTLANPINGHEQANMGNRDLQYACIFKLGTPLLCDQAAFDADKGCDCFAEDQVYNRPLCGGAGGLTQSYAKAYPGTRHLQVLKEFKDNSIVASICPKIADDKTKADYGYNPAVKAIIDRLKEALKGKCLPRPLAPNTTNQVTDGLETGQVPCKVIEAVLPQNGAACSCATNPNRVDTTDVLREAVLTKLKQGESCGDKTGQTKCADYCTCELLQLKGTELGMCQNDSSPPTTPGYCYVNAAPNEPNVGNPDLVKDCSADSKRLLRFVGDTPAPGAIALVACLGAAL
ncbi:MAG: hypothetical protein ABUL60_26590 [Myxococcales bacterium]